MWCCATVCYCVTVHQVGSVCMLLYTHCTPGWQCLYVTLHTLYTRLAVYVCYSTHTVHQVGSVCMLLYTHCTPGWQCMYVTLHTLYTRLAVYVCYSTHTVHQVGSVCMLLYTHCTPGWQCLYVTLHTLYTRLAVDNASHLSEKDKSSLLEYPLHCIGSKFPPILQSSVLSHIRYRHTVTWDTAKGYHTNIPHNFKIDHSCVYSVIYLS